MGYTLGMSTMREWDKFWGRGGGYRRRKRLENWGQTERGRGEGCEEKIMLK